MSASEEGSWKIKKSRGEKFRKFSGKKSKFLQIIYKKKIVN
jgi:hypothetical protein